MWLKIVTKQITSVAAYMHFMMESASYWWSYESDDSTVRESLSDSSWSGWRLFASRSPTVFHYASGQCNAQRSVQTGSVSTREKCSKRRWQRQSLSQSYNAFLYKDWPLWHLLTSLNHPRAHYWNGLCMWTRCLSESCAMTKILCEWRVGFGWNQASKINWDHQEWNECTKMMHAHQKHALTRIEWMHFTSPSALMIPRASACS